MIETDDGEPLKGKGAALELLEDWGKRHPKLVQKILFSMPAGTPPKKLLAAVKNFAREEFGAKAPLRHGAAYR